MTVNSVRPQDGHPDRIVAILAVPIDDELPLDVQGVSLRRKAIDLMEEIATVYKSTVRYTGATDDATLEIEEGHLLSVWQHNVIGVRFIADGKAHDGVCGPITHIDRETRTFSSVKVTRNEFA